MAKKVIKEKDGKDLQKTIKTAVNGVLVAFIVVSIGFAAYKALGNAKKPPEENAAAAGTQQPAALKNKVVLYYLHTTGRCHNCILMEQYSKEAVDKYFQKQLNSGELEYRVYNVDEPAYSHYIQDYQLATKSLVITLVKNGKEQKYENLKGIWQTVGNQEAYHQYVKTNVENYLKEIK